MRIYIYIFRTGADSSGWGKNSVACVQFPISPLPANQQPSRVAATAQTQPLPFSVPSFHCIEILESYIAIKSQFAIVDAETVQIVRFGADVMNDIKPCSVGIRAALRSIEWIE